MTDIFNEIDEDIRRERYQKLWKAYGKYLIFGVVLFVILAASYIAWNNYKENIRKNEGDAFSRSIEMIENNLLNNASTSLQSLSESSSSGYRPLSKLKNASVLISNNKINQGLEIYSDLVNDEKSEKIFRDLARYFIVLYTFDEVDDGKIYENLSYLLNEENPWYYLAKEMNGFRLIKLGKYEDAVKIFNSLSNDSNSPSGIRMRSFEILGYLKNKQ